jgi:gluconate kinase
MQAFMLQGQFDTLEEPANAFTVDIVSSVDKIVESLIKMVDAQT